MPSSAPPEFRCFPYVPLITRVLMLKEAYVLSEKKVQGQTYCCETTAPRLVCLTQKPMLLVYYTIPHSIGCAGVVQKLLPGE